MPCAMQNEIDGTGFHDGCAARRERVAVLGLVCYAPEPSGASEWPRPGRPCQLGAGQADQSLERNARPIKQRALHKYTTVSADAAYVEPYNEFWRETPAAASQNTKSVINSWPYATHRWTGRALAARFGMLALSRSCGSAQFAARLGRRWPRGTRRLRSRNHGGRRPRTRRR